MGQQPIPGKKSGRQKKPLLALPSDNTIHIPCLEVSLELREDLRLHDEVGRGEPREALFPHVGRLRRHRVALRARAAAARLRGRGGRGRLLGVEGKLIFPGYSC